MSRLTAIAAAIVLLALSAPASGQSWEASGLLGYTPSVGLDRRAPELTELDIQGGFTWGLQGGHLFTSRWGAEVLWMQQASALRLGTEAGAADLFTMTIRQLQGNVLYHFGNRDTKLQPFVFGGMGATDFSADDLESEKQIEFAVGAVVRF